MSKLIFEKSHPGANGFALSPMREDMRIPDAFLRAERANLPEVSEVEFTRHFMELSKRAFGVDDGMYPLGSCTMKYNPKVNEWAARQFAALHPLLPEKYAQGVLSLLYDAGEMLKEILGMDAFTLQPAAGAQGEMTGVAMIRAYHEHRGDHRRTKMLVPDSAHGTNPATAHVVGYDVVEVASNENGLVDLDDLRAKMNDEVAGLMLTNPNTLGLFEKDILAMAEIVHGAGGLLYYDGANLNAIMGMARPGDMGFDVVHVNLHKTFATPHGGGGPGSGPVGAKAHLAPFLPVPVLQKDGGAYRWDFDRPLSIGQMHAFYGNVGVVVKAYAYMLALGAEGIRDACRLAVLAANYLRVCLGEDYDIAYDALCKHEFVLSAARQMHENHVGATDICKRLIDMGYHPPTVHFPLIVKEALMIEPNETESLERLDGFVEAMRAIARECRENPEIVRTAPHTCPITRVDEVKAARNPVVKYEEA